MVKYLLILINSLFFFLFNLFSGDPIVTVTGKVPEKIMSGIESPVEIVVSKGELTGFAKLQVDIPEGITIKESDEAGATYSFEEGMAKWVWASLPEDEEITVRFTIIADNEAGKKNLTAKFSYVENNEKKVSEMEPAEFTVESGSGEPLAENEPQVDSLLTGAKRDSGIVSTIPEISHHDPPGPVAVTRKIENTGSSERLVMLQITKGATKGFARYSDDLPEGILVKGGESDGASFSVADGKIKFVWVNVPEKEVLNVSYSFSVEESRTIVLSGEYSYLENNQSKKIKLEPETLNLELTPLVKEETKEEKTEEEQTGVTVAEQEVVSNEQPASGEGNKSGVRKQPEFAAEKGPKTVYKVQIGAFSKKKMTGQKLEKAFRLQETISSEMQEGFSKFMVGKHTEYRDARDHRERLISENKIKSAFVVAYNHGKRITVQEALMITNQKWLK